MVIRISCMKKSIRMRNNASFFVHNNNRRDAMKSITLNSLIGALIGVPLFVVTLIFMPNMIFIELALVLAVMKYIEKENKGEVKLFPACIIWFVIVIYLIYILITNGFVSAGFNSTIIYTICGFSILLPFFLLKLKNRNRFLNLLYPCIIWSILILIIFNFDIRRVTTLAGISIALMTFPIVIFVLNVLFETFREITNKIKG